MRPLLITPVAVALLALSACSGTREDGNGNPPPPPPACTATTCGTVLIGLTDADGDFLSYSVDVISLELEHTNGDVVETLPEPQRVDFAELRDVTEFVTAATIPNGNYVRAFMRLDYSNAEVSVELGGAPDEAVILGENGDFLGIVDIELELDAANNIVVASAQPALLQIEFDLETAHAVNPLTFPTTVVAEPFLAATIVPVAAKDFRARGPLVSVNTTAGSYVVDLRPFNHPDADHGLMTVATTATTDFEVDGQELVGAPGLQAVAVAGAGTPTAALGEFNVATRVFTADRVLAGDSVPGADLDVVIGNVIARSGNDLIVRGGNVIRRDDSVVFARGDIAVSISSNTDVTQEFSGGNLLDTGDISVGQRIQAYGDAGSSNVNPDLDATNGRVRLHETRLVGTVVDTFAGELTLDLFEIDGRGAEFFDFNDTGGSLLTDADPNNYEIDAGALDLAEFDVNEPAEAFGHVAEFGFTPPDFTANTLVELAAIRALLGVSWGVGGTGAPFLSMSSTRFVLNIANPDLGVRRHIEVGPQRSDITTLGAPLTIKPDTGPTLFAVGRPGIVEVFRDFASFEDQVSRLLVGGSTMHDLTARGSFDADSTTLTADHMAVTFRTP